MTMPDNQVLPAMVTLWRELLRRPELDADADFFSAGGQSMLAVRLLQRARDAVGVRPTISTLVSAPTPRTFTARLLELRAEREQSVTTNGRDSA
jgi:hypothetical protein